MNRHAPLALASAFLAISGFVISLKLLQPASVSVYLGNARNSTLVTRIPGLYSFSDVLEIFLSTLVIGVSGTYILLSGTSEGSSPVGEIALSQRRSQWEEISKTLKDEEVKVYQAILDAGGVMNQGDIGEKVGLSKTTVSRVLDLLERRGLVEKRRRGMSNVILLK